MNNLQFTMNNGGKIDNVQLTMNNGGTVNHCQLSIVNCTFLLFLLAAALALYLVFTPRNAPVAPPVPSAPPAPPARDTSIIAWRTPISSKVECLCADNDGWVAGERSGRITALASDGGIRWQVTVSNHNWQAIAPLPDGNGIVAASMHGVVCALDSADGSTHWSRETDATFLHAPLFGTLDETPVMWIISQADSTIFCLRTADGEEVWKSEPSNRCDGRPALWNNRLAFGNCDGVVYVVDAKTGQPIGTIDTGGQDDPMAGQMLALPSGRMFTGTYQGNFLMLDMMTLTCTGKVKVADSEAFCTPIMYCIAGVWMGTPDGRVILFIVLSGEIHRHDDIQVGKDSIDEMVYNEDKVLWVLAGRTFCRVKRDHDVQPFNIGDNMKCLTAHPKNETLALLADGDVVCIDPRRDTK